MGFRVAVLSCSGCGTTVGISIFSPMKRVLDLVCAAAGLILLSPLFVVIALAIRIDDGGQPFYRGWRVGLDGRPFRMLKFRTMRQDAERAGASSTANDDSRLTNIGRALRQYKLDELPQLLNVLKGDMSLVGPRPEVQRFVDLYTEEEKAILSVRPGLTDWATLWNLDEGAILQGSSDPDRTYCELIRPTKIRLQLAYVRQADFWIDLRVLVQTIAVLVFRVRWQPSHSLETHR